MSGGLHFRRANGRFRPTPSLEELGFDVATGARICRICGETWQPILVTGRCPKCGAQDSTALAREGRR